MVEEVARFPQKRFARARELDAVARAREQNGADVVLEPFDHSAERRLRHDEPLGGAPKVKLFGNHDESLQPSEIGQDRDRVAPLIKRSCLPGHLARGVSAP